MGLQSLLGDIFECPFSSQWPEIHSVIYNSKIAVYFPHNLLFVTMLPSTGHKIIFALYACNEASEPFNLFVKKSILKNITTHNINPFGLDGCNNRVMSYF